MDRVITQQVRVGLDRAEVVDGNDFDVGAAGFDDGAQNVAADATKTVDGNFNSHMDISNPVDNSVFGAFDLHAADRRSKFLDFKQFEGESGRPPSP